MTRSSIQRLLRNASRLALWSLVLPALVSAQRVDIAEDGLKPIAVESAEISTEITGRIAVTTFDLVFGNPNDRVLEGTFVFPLLGGQRVTGFALDVNGNLRQAVPVEKARGRIVFEQIERRGVDPGLAEQAEGDVYRTRIYPLPAKGTRRLQLTYQEDLAPAREQTTYRLNLQFPEKLPHFRLRLNVRSAAAMPAQVRTGLALQLPPWRDAQFMDVERSDFEARGLVEIVLPKAERPRVMTGRYRGKEYFYAEVPVTPILFSRPAPKTVGLLWDSSASGRARDHEKELALLHAWFADLKNVEVRLIRLRDRATRDGSYAVKNGDWSALRKELESTVYDGGTSLDGLVDDAKVDAWILFSDGFFNFGAVSPSPKLELNGVVHTVLAATQANTSWLRSAAAYRRGEYIDLLRTEPAKAAFNLQAETMRLLGVDYDPEAVAQVFPEIGAPLQGETLALTGVLRKPSASVRLQIGHTRDNAQTLELSLLSGDDLTPLAARAWAVAKIEALSAEKESNAEDLRRTSREFGIVTADTSLIVLEDVRDYARYEIEPPEELRAEWEAHRQATSLSPRAAKQHLENVRRAFQERIAWWERTFPKTKPKRDEAAPAPPNNTILAAEAADPELQLHAFEVASQRQAQERTASVRTALRREAESSMEMAGPDAPAASIILKPWSPQSGYMDHFRRAKRERRYAVYLEERPEHQREPGFFLDVADAFFETGDMNEGLRVLSNLAELQVDDPAILRVLAHRLMQAERADLAVPVFERVLALRPEEPQSRRDFALALAAVGQFQRAVDLLWELVSQPWDSRFPSIEVIALTELNAIAATCGQKLDLSRIDARLLRNLPLDLRVVLTWDANDTDIDLWMDDPNGQTARYDFPLTFQGGLMSRDFTGGYGPEEYVLKEAKAGVYVAKINYYGDRRQAALGPVTAQIRFITGFGTPAQQEKLVTVRLKDKQETLEVGSIDIGAAGAKKGR